MSPECDTCPNSATRAIRDNARGWGNGTKNSPHRNACDDCYAALLADIDPDDPWAREYPTIRTYPKDTTMTTQPDTAPLADTLADTLAPLAAEYAALAEKSEQIKNRQEEIKATIRDLVPGADKYSAGALTVTVSPNRRFDERRALAMLPEHVLPLVTFPETRIDKDRLKVLAPDVFEAAQETFAERVSIR